MRAHGIDLHRDLFAIRTGCGIGFCQSALAARHADLTAILPNAITLRPETWIIMHADLRRVARVRTVFDHLVRTVGAYAKL